MAEDWRVTVELEEGSGHGLLAQVGEEELEDEVREQLGNRVAVSADERHLFLYADTRETAESARDVVRSILENESRTATFALDRWHPVAEEWEPADAPLPATEAEREEEREEAEEQDEAETEESGYAEWEVRIDLPGHGDAVELAERLEAESIPVTRRWKFLLVGAATEDDANALADQLRAEAPAGSTFTVEPSGEMAWEGAPQRSKWFFVIPNM